MRGRRPGRALPRIKNIAPLLAAVVVAGLTVFCAGSCSRPAPPRDLILITIDTLRADRLGSYGHANAVTPVLDALAARGVRFTQASTPMPRTTPGLASLLTGLWPQNHGSREVGSAITSELPSLAERLQSAGFRTFGISANGAAGPRQGLDRGFEHLEVPPPNQRRGPQVTAGALALVESVSPDDRLFLWAHYIDPHFPYVAPGSRERPGSEACYGLVDVFNRGRFQAGRVFYNDGGISEAALDSCSMLYDDEIAYTDQAIGTLLDTLETQGHLDNALIVVTADHGENFGEHGLYYQHGSSLHEASMRVPLIIASPQTSSAVDDALIDLTDLAPSLLQALGIDALADDFDGSDQSSRFGFGHGIFGDVTPPATLGLETGSALVAAAFDLISSGRAGGFHCTNGERYSLCQRPDVADALYDHEVDPSLEHDLAEVQPREVRRLTRLRERWPPEFPRRRAVRDERFKLVEIPRRRGGYARVLYDLEHDVAESTDVSADHPDVVARLALKLDAWIATLPQHSEPEERDDETLEQLRALGYID